MKMLVSVIIPTYNRLEYLKEAVQSALLQTYQDIEIVIGQDPTPSGLNESIKAWAEKAAVENDKIKYFYNSTNLGLAGNWNACLKKATGDFVIIIGDDDRLISNAIEELVIGCKKGADVSFSNHFLINENGEQMASSISNTARFNRDGISEGFLLNAGKNIWQNALPVSAALINTTLAKEITFSEHLNTPEIEMFLKINLKGGKFYFTPQYLAEYRVHSHSATKAGLLGNYLFDVLKHIPVSNENKIYKWRFLNRLASAAINLYLSKGNKQKAIGIYVSEYYPFKNRFSVKGLVQAALFFLPTQLAKRILTKRERKK